MESQHSRIAAEQAAAPRRLFTFELFSQRNPSWTVPSLRALRFDATQFDRHGFGAAGAFVQIGRKVLIDEEKFYAAITARQQAPQRRSARAA